MGVHGSKTLLELRWPPHSAASGPRHEDSPAPDAVCGFPVTVQQPWARRNVCQKLKDSWESKL